MSRPQVPPSQVPVAMLRTMLSLVLIAQGACLRLPSSVPTVDRRDALALLGLASTLAGRSLPAVAGPVSESVEALRKLPPDTDRYPLSLVQRSYMTRESADVEYPAWFAGKWRCTSTLESVVAPAGVSLFTPGRNGTEALRRARLEIGQPLVYDSRWKPGETEGTYVVDRGFNVAAISAASMGAAAVQNVEEKSVDRLELILKPDAGGRVVYRAQLDVIARHTDAVEAEGRFDCVETVRQSIVVVPGEGSTAPQRPPMVKEVETLCTYERRPDGKIVGSQRTATFLVPDAAYTSGSSLAEQQALVLARGPNGQQTALDVRVYSLVYEKV